MVLCDLIEIKTINMKSYIKAISPITLAVLAALLPAVNTQATPLLNEGGVNNNVTNNDTHASDRVTYDDTHASERNLVSSGASSAPSNDTHANSKLHAGLQELTFTLGVTQTTPNYKDTHANDANLSPINASNDTHANVDVNAHSNEIPRTLTQVPYSALGVLPTSEHDSQFSYGDDPLQSVYVWHGRGGDENEFAGNAVIFVHGGCWLNAYGYDHAKGFYHALAELGMGVYAMEYRRVGDEGGGWPGSLEDVTSALKASIENIEATGVSGNIYLVGHSAGGHLGLLAAQQLSSSEVSKSIKQVIGLAAITNVQSYALGENSCQTATPQFMGGMPTENKREYQTATPDAAAIKPPVILLQGNEDSIVPEHHATMPSAKNRIITNGGHFDWLHPESTSFDALLEVISQHDK